MSKVSQLEIGKTYRHAAGGGYGSTTDRHIYGTFVGTKQIEKRVRSYRARNSHRMTTVALFEVVGMIEREVTGKAKPITKSGGYGGLLGMTLELEGRMFDTEVFDAKAHNAEMAKWDAQLNTEADKHLAHCRELVPTLRVAYAVAAETLSYQLCDTLTTSKYNDTTGKVVVTELDDEAVAQNLNSITRKSELNVLEVVKAVTDSMVTA